MKASSESGECASLISTVSFSVFEAACWPDMGLLVSFQVRTRSAWLRPALILPRDYPAHERGCRGAKPATICKRKPNILACREQLAGPWFERQRERKRRRGIAGFTAKRPCERWRRRRRQCRQGKAARISEATSGSRSSRAGRGPPGARTACSRRRGRYRRGRRQLLPN